MLRQSASPICRLSDELAVTGDLSAGRNSPGKCLIGLRRSRHRQSKIDCCYTNDYERISVMPLINVKVIEGVFSAEQKTQIIRKLTDAMVDIEGEAMRPVTWTVIEEVKSGEWGIAGKPLSTADVRALAAARSAKVG
jgi:4-oxalocrotonate tautomerase